MAKLDSEHRFESIDYSMFMDTLALYPETVPSKLNELDRQRYELIPKDVATLKSSREAYLTKAQVQVLVDWKLTHGTFRPSLKKLVASNSDSDIRSITQCGFATFVSSNKDIKASINILAQLKGVGPATASLILSVFDQETVPFFSDELFRWSLWEKTPGKGWDRKIGYSVREYVDLCARVEVFRSRIRAESGSEVGAVEAEKVAYVLGKRDIGPPAEAADQKLEAVVVAGEKCRANAQMKPDINGPRNAKSPKPSKERQVSKPKVVDVDEPEPYADAALRRSKRRKH